MLVKLKAPHNAGPITYAGLDYPVQPDGSIEVPDALWPALSSHGFSVWVEGPANDFFSTLNRNACFRWAAEHGLKISTPVTALAAQEACRAHAKTLTESEVHPMLQLYDQETSGLEEIAFPPAAGDPPSDQQPFFEA